ncbi:MAG: aldehyde dehydrogenase [Deltaproteobacteria bacterium]|nr:aldehyde dehydrogenase [Deltaproteobacteria bacterium]MBW2120059.1 aldehyde dehydrogenase [Deltaproteobacteria bacterium]MBW2342543.1 aldehyde dehydrogenase [Deltaproteobacteria bacterium]
MEMLMPDIVLNWIGGEEFPALSGKYLEKLNPASGKILCRLARSEGEDIVRAVDVAKKAQPLWGEMPPVQRGMLLNDLAMGMKERREDIAGIVAIETGKSYKEAVGETDGAIALGLFYAGEGQRLYGRTTTSGVTNKYAMTVRQPIGVAGLIIAANTPIANVAWKIFPAMICGNAVILKAAEDTPATAWIVGAIAKEIGLPHGVLNIMQGLGEECGAPLVAHPDVGVVSFTGSTRVGRMIAEETGKRLARVSLELGGKNPLVVCDDADLDNAAKWVLLSAFSNAGQRCASASRVIIFEDIYEKFREQLISETDKLKVGSTDEDDFGPVINKSQLDNMLAVVDRAKKEGAIVLIGGDRMTDTDHIDGFYMAPTLIENVDMKDEISTTELFGPIACLYRARDFKQALDMANDSPYGLTACIHAKSIHRAIEFTQKVQTGVVVVNAGTYGSEPHMPFGGFKQSGNGTREPGTEALDIYSALKDIYVNIDPSKL